MTFSGKVEVIKQEKKGPGIFRLDLDAPEICGEAMPGQFVHLKTTDRGYDPLLRRPFSIYDLDRQQGVLSITYKVVGLGTGILSGRQRGETLEIMGPLGRPFSIFEEDRRVLMVAGGVGYAPLNFLARLLQKKNVEVEVLLGARKAEELVGKEDLELLGISAEVAVEEGSPRGYKGRVTDLLERKLKGHSFHRLYSCGPCSMLEQVARLSRQCSLPGEVSLESIMACGVGACLGCAFPVKVDPSSTADNDQSIQAVEYETRYKRICVEGPTFSLEEVF
ncbi:dihydroorotate dehydrogenase electron transfer subunit [Candidatus Contubernalis alkaliaceticus]|uniref:dihydroorotate dehydrogenase electron transfer subunit n=1 Tax=Candidatus Contubernalis alkaliaceticus TaxID=338645 RepID=UPI001F4C37CB|nr:dihydroorotate dehydrogenase electron transfer subunit [Candidatus Contubernalis alkalaceticus]UNC93358.1 dihydroorotate dehydrogenase electron transfer subunit [Candidatus Contubernalis alkalaceticus]